MQRIQLTPTQRQALCKTAGGAAPAAPRAAAAAPEAASKPASVVRAYVSSIKDAVLKGGRVVSLDTARVRAAALASKAEAAKQQGTQ